MEQPSRTASSTPAPIHDVPASRVVSVEHPSIIKNFDNGLKSLGGEAQLKHVSSCLSNFDEIQHLTRR